MLSRATVERAIYELRDAGVIVREPRHAANGAQRSSITRLVDTTTHATSPVRTNPTMRTSSSHV